MEILTNTLSPSAPFLLFGLGDRPKFVFQNGALRRAPGGEPVHEWPLGAEAVLRPDIGRVEIGGEPVVWEDERGLFWRDGARVETVAESSRPLSLPDFAGAPHAALLRTLHREILVNIDDGLPLPNFYVYRKPWRRDGAMMALVLAETGNLWLLRDWAASLDDPFDRNNWGNEEPDNLGQTLFLLGTLGLADHPLVGQTVGEARKRLGPDGVLAGRTDGRVHGVYGACWLRLGLEACGLAYDWVPVPEDADDYGPLFWMRREWVGPASASLPASWDSNYPYLWWAKAHFHRLPVPEELLAPARPLTWERYASQADYGAVAPLAPEWVAARFSAPHTWHAAEMFLYLGENRNT